MYKEMIYKYLVMARDEEDGSLYQNSYLHLFDTEEEAEEYASKWEKENSNNHFEILSVPYKFEE